MSDNLVELPSKYSEMAAATAELRKQLPAMIEYTKIIAEIKWSAYQNLIENGFTEDQALELSKEPLKL